MKAKAIKELETFNRPREKMAEKGSAALSDSELLAVILGSGNKQHDVLAVAKAIHKRVVERKDSLALADLKQIPGVGLAKACQVMAALEYSRRRLTRETDKIACAEDVVALVAEYRHKKQEHFLVLTLDGANQVIEKRVVFIGTLNASMVHPREVFAAAISDRAAAVILVHNHPSGQLHPSAEDLRITERLRQAGDIIGITVLDHIILTSNAHFSFAVSSDTFKKKIGGYDSCQSAD